MSDDPDSPDSPDNPDDADDGFVFPGDGNGESPDATATGSTGSHPDDPGGTDSGGPGPSESRSSEPDSGAPLDDLAERARRDRERPPAEDAVMEAFETVDVDDVAVEDLWTELEGEDLDDTVDEPRSTTEREISVVSKRDYCMRCQYFSAPPEVRCTNEGSEILEMVDTEQFRVADCPILRGEAELENLR